MFHFGFSYVGVLYLILLFVPNIFWTKCRPEGYEHFVKNENKILLALERIGEVLVSACAVVFSDFNIRRTWWAIWLLLSFLFMVLYEIYWLRYFKSRHTMQDMYSSLLGIPVAGASLPVLAFGALAVYGSNAFLLLSVIILGIGHIGIHLCHRNEVLPAKKPILPLRIVKWVLGVLGVLLVAGTLMILAGRNINYLKHYALIQNGIDQEQYLSLGGQQQYILTRGMDLDNPVIVYLHGGPSSPDTAETYCFTDDLADDYTVIAWDQRGCGRTWFANAADDPDNETASFEQALADLDQLVDYARNEYGQDQVIILGHSYGTILGSVYAQEHPEKVSAYIGAAQVISLTQTDLYSYEAAVSQAKAAGADTTELECAYHTYIADPDIVNLLALRSETGQYHPAEEPDQSTKYAVFSPYYGVDDFRWFLKQLGNLEDYIALNQQLFDYTLAFDITGRSLNYDMPVCFISGSCDWVCPTEPIREYAESITAPDQQYEIIDGPGHNLQYTEPEAFAEAVIKLLRQTQTPNASDGAVSHTG